MKTLDVRLTDEIWGSLPLSVRKTLGGKDLSVQYLLTTNSVKTLKGEKQGYLTGVQYLSPSKISGIDVCKSSTAQCVAACLQRSGRMGLGEAHRARLIRTIIALYLPEIHRERIHYEIRSLLKRASRKGMKLAIRLNGTSDLPWESNKHGRLLQDLMGTYPSVEFYDYTKHIGRCLKGYRDSLGIGGYSLTLSYSGTNWIGCKAALESGSNIAVVFESERFPRELQGYQVINGDAHDLRFLDRRGVIVGLKFKLPKRGTGKGTLRPHDVPQFVVSPSHELVKGIGGSTDQVVEIRV